MDEDGTNGNGDDDSIQRDKQPASHPSKKKTKLGKTPAQPTRRNPDRKAKSMHAPYQKLTPILSGDMQDWSMTDSSPIASLAPFSNAAGVQVRCVLIFSLDA